MFDSWLGVAAGADAGHGFGEGVAERGGGWGFLGGEVAGELGVEGDGAEFVAGFDLRAVGGDFDAVAEGTVGVDLGGRSEDGVAEVVEALLAGEAGFLGGELLEVGDAGGDFGPGGEAVGEFAGVAQGALVVVGGAVGVGLGVARGEALGELLLLG